MVAHFAKALRSLTGLFQPVPTAGVTELRFAVIGGLAVSTWGQVRATQDIDVLADSAPSPVQTFAIRKTLAALWEAQGCVVAWRSGLADDPIPLLLRLTLPPPNAMTVDVLWAWRPWQREAVRRASVVPVARASIPVLRPEDLILMKLQAGGPQDLLDVENILFANPPELDHQHLVQTAGKLRLKAVLERCMRRVRQP
ncbi:MAG: hypothetical protein HOP18_00195 [Deltaproteobacteria bacterium]|nr:hypothetical protein [Deltaproteobacteria bacterium]